MMRAIKIDPSSRTIEEIELAVDPNRSLIYGKLCSTSQRENYYFMFGNASMEGINNYRAYGFQDRE